MAKLESFHEHARLAHDLVMSVGKSMMRISEPEDMAVVFAIAAEMAVVGASVPGEERQLLRTQISAALTEMQPGYDMMDMMDKMNSQEN